MAKIKLFCFPHAGGSSLVYAKWKKYLSDTLDVNLLELSGRGKRFNEPLYNSIDEIISDIYPKVTELIGESNYMLFGHSMGSVIAYELAHKIIANNLKRPFHIFFSGRYPPYVRVPSDQAIHLLPDEEFKKEIFNLSIEDDNQIDFFKYEELTNIFLPIIRSDYKNVCTYEHKEKNSLFDFDVSVLSGNKDLLIKNQDIFKWSECTTGNVEYYEFDGGHFFINSKLEEVVKIIKETTLFYNEK